MTASLVPAADRPLAIGVDCRFVQDKFHGIGRYTYQLLRHVCALAGPHTITAFVDPTLPNRRFPFDVLIASGKLRVYPMRVPLYHPAELTAWRTLLQTHRVDVFHSPYFWSPLTLPCPLVTTIHDMIFDRYPEYMPERRFALLYKIMSRLAMRRSRRVIAVSDATRRDITTFTRTAADKICVVPEGVDATFMPVADEHIRRAVRARYGLPPRYLLALGARRPHKNIARLVTAFSHVAADVPHTLVLVGAVDARFAPADEAIIAQLRHTGRIVEIDYVAEEDLPAVYTLADLFVQPSIIEGFGLPVIEAMACGCPVACSNTSSLPEVAGDAAALFEPRDTAAIAATLRHLLNDPAQRDAMALRGRRRARHFTWASAAQQTLEIYHHATT